MFKCYNGLIKRGVVSINNIYIVLSNTGSVLSRAIGLITKDEYNHVSITSDDTFETLYSFGRLVPNNPFVGGFVEESFYSGTFKKFKNTTCMILKVDVTRGQLQEFNITIESFVRESKLYSYGLVELMLAGFGIDKSRRNRYYCSSFVKEVMEKSNLIELNGIVRPSYFTNLGYEVVYEGLISEFPKQSVLDEDIDAVLF